MTCDQPPRPPLLALIFAVVHSVAESSMVASTKVPSTRMLSFVATFVLRLAMP